MQFTHETNISPCPLAILVAIISAFWTSFAFAGDLTQALSIAADSAEIDERQGMATYSGQVELKQGHLLIQCDLLQIFRNATGIDKVIARGSPAKFSQTVQLDDKSVPEKITAQAKRMTYQLESKAIELVGEAKIQQEGNQFQGHSIIYQIEGRRIIAKSSESASDQQQRVKIVLPLQKDTDEKL